MRARNSAGFVFFLSNDSYINPASRLIFHGEINVQYDQSRRFRGENRRLQLINIGK